jgi:hypothetical protein
MVMHPHTKYHLPISKDKNVMVRTRKYYFKKQLFDLEVKGHGHTKVITVCDTLPGQRSRSHEGHYGMRHTALWSCSHKLKIIDLSGKTKKLWSGQASLRRSRRRRRNGSGRKNQTKTICLPTFEGET